MKGRGFVAVHVGAGYHSPANGDLYKEVCRKACHQAIQLLKNRHSALEAVVAAIVALENSQWTNAGVGSNLTLTGTVECDASIMDGRSLHYGAVGAVSGVKNPIKVAESLMNLQFEGEMSLGRLAPCTLVGQGAYDWAKDHGLSTINDKNGLITENSRKTFIKNKRKLDMFNEDFDSAYATGASFKILKLDDNSNNLDRNISNCNSNKTVSAINRTVENTQTSDVPVDEIASNIEIVSDVTSGINIKLKLANDNRGSGVRGRIPKFNVVSKNNLTQRKGKLKNNNNSSNNIPNLPINNTDSDDINKNNNNSDNYSNYDDNRKVDVLNDTVGAICVDEDGRIVSAVSSGGIILKQPGRLGQAALYGCGCWSENDENGQFGVAACTSGCGEQLIKTTLAKECVLTLKEFIGNKNKNNNNSNNNINNSNNYNNNDDDDGDDENGDGDDTSVMLVQECFNKKFINSPFLRYERQPLGGALMVTVEKKLEENLERVVAKQRVAAPKNVDGDDTDDSNDDDRQVLKCKESQTRSASDNSPSTCKDEEDDDDCVDDNSDSRNTDNNHNDLSIELLWAHTTESMCLGYMSTNDTQAKAVVSRLPASCQAGKSVLVQSKWCYI